MRQPVPVAPTPASAIAPRTLLASFVTTLGAGVVEGLVVGAYLLITDHSGVGLGHKFLALARVVGIGALVGLISGLFIMLFVTWGAMASRNVVARGGWWARGFFLGAMVLAWALVMVVGLKIIGFWGLGGQAWLLSLPGLVAALISMWFWAPWVADSVTPVDAR